MTVEPGFFDFDADAEARARVVAILGEDGLRRTFAPIEDPSGLPNAAYWSDDWLALENERLFQRAWVFAGAAAEAAAPGALKPMEIGGVPIVLVGGGNGTVRAFHNVCRHRGTRLVDAPCAKSQAITCPYHAWSYRLDGSIRARPHFHGADTMERFDAAGDPALNLYPVRCETWNGCVFVDVSGKAPDLLEWLAPMLRRTRAFDFSQIRWIAKKTYTIKSNWKLVLENYMEGYHVFAAHPRLIAHAPMNVRWSGEWMDHVFYNDYVVPKLTAGRGDGLPWYPNLSDEDARRGMWFACMPNFAAEVYADQFVVLASYPVAPDETYEELHLFVVGDEAAASDAHAAGREALISMWDDLNLEDKAILERLQQGRRSPAFEGSIMSPAWEVPAHQLSQQIVRSIVARD
jgi:choline monooxygenase